MTSNLIRLVVGVVAIVAMYEKLETPWSLAIPFALGALVGRAIAELLCPEIDE